MKQQVKKQDYKQVSVNNVLEDNDIETPNNQEESPINASSKAGTFEYYDENGRLKYKQNKCDNMRMARIIFASAILIFVYVLFVDIMEHRCPEDKYPTDDDCMQYLADNIFLWAQILIIVGGLLILVCYMAAYNFIEKFFILASTALSVYLCLFKYSIDPSEVKVREFEGAHALFLIAVLVTILIVLQLISACVGLYKFSKRAFAFLYFVLFCLFVWLYVEAEKSCDGWENGLTGKIDNTGDYCYVQKPWVCWPVVINNLLKFGPKSCEIDEFAIKKNRETVLDKYGFLKGKSGSEKKKFIEESNYLAWPLFTHFSNSDRKYDVVQELFQERTQIVDSVQSGFDMGSEIVLNLKDNKMEINIKRNETIVQNARQKHQEFQQANNNSIESLSDNIVIVYIDTLSRAQTHRKLPKSMDYLRNYAVPKDSTNKQIYEFYRFHSIDKKTNNNAFKMQFDYRYKEVDEDLKNGGGLFDENKKVPNLMNEFRNAGYVTAHIMNTCTAQCLFREKYVPIQKYFQEDPSDHEFTIWDPLYVNPDNYYDVAQGPSAISRRCLYGNDTSAQMNEYAIKFMDAYEGERQAIFLEYTDAHEITSEVIQFMDDHLYNFLKDIDKKTDNNTIVYFIADHGQHLVQSFYLQENKINPLEQYAKFMKDSMPSKDVYQSERMLPLLQIMVSNDILKKNPEVAKNLEKNQQIILGMAEFRNSLMSNAVGLEMEKYKNNVWNYRESSLSCLDIEQVKDLDPVQYCVCRPYDWRPPQ